MISEQITFAFGEMEQYLKEIGFQKIVTYSSFQKKVATDETCEMFLFEYINS